MNLYMDLDPVFISNDCGKTILFSAVTAQVNTLVVHIALKQQDIHVYKYYSIPFLHIDDIILIII